MNHKLLEYVKKEIAKIEADGRYKAKPADYETNAILASIQIGFAHSMNTLYGVKKEIEAITQEEEMKTIKILFRSLLMEEDVLEFKDISVEEALRRYYKWWEGYGEDAQYALGVINAVKLS